MKSKEKIIFYSGGFLLAVVYILIFKPIANYGDGPTYLRFAHLLAENSDTSAFINSSPFYPWTLSLIISAFGEKVAIDTLIVIQYLLLFLSIVLLYKMLVNSLKIKSVGIFAATAAMVNLSAIFYGFMLQTETMTLFFLILTIWFLLKGLDGDSLLNYFLSGVALSAMILLRFNTFPMTFIFLLIIFLLGYSLKKFSLMMTFRNLAIFALPVIVILNSFAFMNYQKHDFYGLFPLGGSELVSRNALLATIDGSERVSQDNKPVLSIFIKASEQVSLNHPSEKKGSLIRIARFKFSDKLYKGFPVYSTALPELCKYFNINPDVPEPDLSGKLAPFFIEIRKLNRDKIWNIRILSLLSSLRSSSGLVIPDKPDTNLGKLPFWIIAGHKLLFFIFSTMVFTSSIIYLISCLTKLIKPDQTLILFILIILGFFFINFAFATAGDANRFKYPAEPLIISLGVYYIYISNNYFKAKLRLTRKMFHNRGTRV